MISTLTRYHYFVLMMFSLPMSACTPGANPSCADDRNDVRNVIEGIIAADNNQDLERVMAFYSEDAVLIAPSGPNIVGSDAIRAHYETLFATAKIEITNTIDEIIVRDDWAIARGVNDVVSVGVASATSKRVSSKYLMSLHRLDSHGWQISHLMWSDQEKLPAKAN